MTDTSLLLQALADISDMRQAIGVVQGQNNLVLRDLQSAADSRKDLHKKVEYLGASQVGLGQRVEHVEHEIEKILPIIEALQAAHHEKVGAAKMVSKMLGWLTSAKAAITAIIAAIGGSGAWWWWWKH